MADPRRFAEVDYLRGLAILAVVGVHVAGNFAKIGQVNGLYVGAVMGQVFLRFAVPLFLLISGFVLSRRYGQDVRVSLAEFYRRRLGTILLPYLFFSALYMAAYGAVDGWPSPRQALLKLVTAGAAEHLWFFRLIFLLYLLYPFLLRVYDRQRARGAATRFLAAVFLCQVAANVGIALGKGALASRGLGFTVYLLIVAQFWFYFVLGFHVARHFETIRAGLDRVLARIWWPVVAAAAALAALNTFFYILGQRHGVHVYWASVAFTDPFLFLAVFVLCDAAAARLARRAGGPLSRLVSEAGRYSYGVYLVHILFLGIFFRFAARAGITPADALFYPVLFLSTALASWAAAAAMGRTRVMAALIGAR